MKTLRHRGFTLTELLMGMVLVLIIMGSVVAVLKTGLNLYTKAEAKSLVIEGVRFTADSHRRRIIPMLSSASEVELLASNASIPTTVSANNHYIYLLDHKVMHKSESDNIALEGSEYINSLGFTLPTSSADISANYILKMAIGGQNQNYTETAKLDLTVESPLYNKPLKSGGTIVGSSYSGKVLRFVASQISFDIVLKDLKIKKDNVSGEDLSNRENVAKGTKLFAGYVVEPSEDPGFTLKDCSDVRWYISGSSSINVDPGGAEIGLPIPSVAPAVDNRINYCWLLVDASNHPITGKTLLTDGIFYVRTISGVRSWGNYGIVRYYVKSAMQKADGTNTIYGPAKQSPFAAITPVSSSRGGRLWREWMKSLQDIQSGGEGTEGFFNTGVAGVELQIDYVTGETHLIIRRPAGGTAGSVTVAVSGGYLFEDEKREVLETDGKSYTTLTNYSLLVDADVLAGNGYALLLNGASVSDNPNQFTDCGYMFQYDQAIDAFPMRLYANGNHNSSGGTMHYGMSIQYEEDCTTPGDLTALPSGRISGIGVSSGNYGPFYGPGHMKNSIFKYVSNSDWKKRPIYAPWTSRRRFVITILEYYLNGNVSDKKGPMYPRFIMRLKLLKNFEEMVANGYNPTTDDPWKIGNEAFYSEPVWYGGFVGDPTELNYQKRTRKNSSSSWSSWIDISKLEYDNLVTNNTTQKQTDGYRYSVRNYSSYLGDFLKFTNAPAGSSNKTRYIAKMPWGDNYSSTSDSLIFNASDMNVRNDIKTGAFDIIGKNVGTIDESFKSPNRKRYIGLRIWGGVSTSSKFYSVNYAPGFKKSELQAIMPAGGRMYEFEDTSTSDKNGTGEIYVSGVDQKFLNQGLFGSKTGSSPGNGKYKNHDYDWGVMAIQHVMSGCDCPMCSN